MNIDNLVQYIYDMDFDIQVMFAKNGTTHFIANWNHYPKIEHMLEKIDQDKNKVDILSSDNYMCCDGCQKCIPYYYNACMMVCAYDDALLCPDCVDDYVDEILEYHMNNCKRAIPWWFIEYANKEGFVCFDDHEKCKQFENGIHEGQNDNPCKIITKMRQEGKLHELDYLIAVTNVEQFTTTFTLLVREKEE